MTVLVLSWCVSNDLPITLIEQQGVEQRVLSGQAVSCQFNLSYLLFMIRVNSLLCVLDKNRKESISKMHYK